MPVPCHCVANPYMFSLYRDGTVTIWGLLPQLSTILTGNGQYTNSTGVARDDALQVCARELHMGILCRPGKPIYQSDKILSALSDDMYQLITQRYTPC